VQIIDRSDTDPQNVPAGVVWEAKSVFRQRLGGEVAVLVWDSLLDEGAPNGHHHLRFEHPTMWIEVSVSVLPAGSSLHGVVHPAVPLRVELQSERSVQPLVAEVTQHAFRIEEVAHGLVRLNLLEPGLTSAICTEWFCV
jgi:hypothetical protein